MAKPKKEEHKHNFGPWYDNGARWKDGNGDTWQPIARSCLDPNCSSMLTSNKKV